MSNDIETLRARATSLGLKFSGNTGVKTLEDKIAMHLADAAEVSTAALLGDNEPLPEIIKPKVMPKGPPSLAQLQIMNVQNYIYG